MSEMSKTSAFVGAGAAALLAAFLFGAKEPNVKDDELVGEQINRFDPEAPTSLRVVKFDASTGVPNDFQVAKRNGLWTIPSKQGYPADAVEHMGEAASCVANLKILRVQSRSPQEHEELGLVDPLASGLDSNSKGVGMRIVMTDAKDENLVDMIIGGKVKETEDQYYIRRSNQDASFVVKLDPSKLTTRFEDWIEDDLLGLNSFDMRKLFLNDYSAQLGMVLGPQGIQMQVSWDRRGQFTLNYDETDSKWKPALLQSFDKDSEQLVDFQLQDDEEINEDALRELRNGLDDLLIVDVEKKPSGLSGDLKAGDDFLAAENEVTMKSLVERGFAPVALSRGGPLEILSSEGEVICTLRNGVEYVLRFGKLKTGTSDDSSSAPKADEADGEKAGETNETPESQLNRYLFVMARFNEDIINKPELQQVPELPPGATAPADQPAADAKPATESPATENPATENEEEEEEQPVAESNAANSSTAENAAADTPASDAKGESANNSEPQLVDGPPADQPPPPDVVDDDAQKPQADAASEASSSVPPAPGAPASPPAGDTPAANDEKPAEPESLESLIARRKSIEAENNRKLEEYQKSIKEGQEKVADLNLRFGDWYYVISDKVYKQIRVDRETIIKKKSAEKPADEANPHGSVPGLPGIPNLPIGK